MQGSDVGERRHRASAECGLRPVFGKDCDATTSGFACDPSDLIIGKDRLVLSLPRVHAASPQVERPIHQHSPDDWHDDACQHKGHFFRNRPVSLFLCCWAPRSPCAHRPGRREGNGCAGPSDYRAPPMRSRRGAGPLFSTHVDRPRASPYTELSSWKTFAAHRTRICAAGLPRVFRLTDFGGTFPRDDRSFERFRDFVHRHCNGFLPCLSTSCLV